MADKKVDCKVISGTLRDGDKEYVAGGRNDVVKLPEADALRFQQSGIVRILDDVDEDSSKSGAGSGTGTGTAGDTDKSNPSKK